jgi:hypothetical protein
MCSAAIAPLDDTAPVPPVSQYLCSGFDDFGIDYGIQSEFKIETNWPEGEDDLRLLSTSGRTVYSGPSIQKIQENQTTKSQRFLTEGHIGNLLVKIEKRNADNRMYIYFENSARFDALCERFEAKKK